MNTETVHHPIFILFIKIPKFNSVWSANFRKKQQSSKQQVKKQNAQILEFSQDLYNIYSSYLTRFENVGTIELVHQIVNI